MFLCRKSVNANIKFEKNIRVLVEGQEKIINTYSKRVKARVCPKCGKVELYIDLNG